MYGATSVLSFSYCIYQLVVPIFTFIHCCCCVGLYSVSDCKCQSLFLRAYPISAYYVLFFISFNSCTFSNISLICVMASLLVAFLPKSVCIIIHDMLHDDIKLVTQVILFSYLITCVVLHYVKITRWYFGYAKGEYTIPGKNC